jgi:hypothetical protein
MCGIIFSCFESIYSCLRRPERRPVPFTDEELRAMPATRIPNFTRPRHPPRPTVDELYQYRRARAYSTRSRQSDTSQPAPQVRFPVKCPAGERAVQLERENLLQQQRENLSINYDTHHTYREPPPSDTSSAVSVPNYVTENFDHELAMRYSRCGKPKVDRSRIRRAPAPRDRRPTVFDMSPYSLGPRDVGEWRYEPLRASEAVGYKLPRERAKLQSFIVDLAATRVWWSGNGERMKKEARDKRLAAACQIPPPRDTAMLRRRPLRMAGGFPSTPTGPWYGSQRPELPNGVAWRVGGTLPNIAPTGRHAPSTQQRRGRTMGPLHEYR